MTKAEFLNGLRTKLKGLPHDVIMESLEFYSEMIDDRIEEGVSEEDVISTIGDPEDIANQIISETSMSKILKHKLKPKRKIGALTIVLLILGSPIWVSLLIAAFAIMISVFAVIFSLIIALWAIDVSLAACFFGGISSGTISIVFTSLPSGLFLIGCGLICAALSVFLFFGCRAATVGTFKLIKKIIFSIKRNFIRGEAAQ